MALALHHGKRPIVVPRLRQLGEAVDDHQLVVARRLAALGLVTLIEDVGQLRAEVAARSATFSGPVWQRRDV